MFLQFLYNLIQLQNNWGKSLENAPKINNSFLGDEWKREEQILYAIDDEISSMIDNEMNAELLIQKIKERNLLIKMNN